MAYLISLEQLSIYTFDQPIEYQYTYGYEVADASIRRHGRIQLLPARHAVTPAQPQIIANELQREQRCHKRVHKIGRESCRERECQYGAITVITGSLKKKTTTND